MRLAEKLALISGGSHGIGKATALAFASAGADVALTYRERDAGARETAALIESKGRRAFVMQADLTKPDDCKQNCRRDYRHVRAPRCTR